MTVFEVAQQAGDQADKMGCTFAIQIGEQPTAEEVRAEIEKRLSPKPGSDAFRAIAAWAILGASNEESRGS